MRKEKCFYSPFRSWLIISFLLLVFVSGVVLSQAEPQQKEQPQQHPSFATAFGNLKFREIGPAIMGGRVDDFAVVESDPKIVYMALASGGLWKTTNAGTTWEPVFDTEAVSTIGAVAVAPSDPSLVWAGTGEPNNRQSSSWGSGVYKSTDAGLTWKQMGLDATCHIGRIVIHPSNPDVVYAAALGRLWGPNPERGVFKTTDGGRTWKHSFSIDQDTGVADLAMDLQSPDTLYAAAYQRRRTVFGFNGSGPHSALYKTSDGGETWRKLSRGLPYENEEASETGRIGICVYRRNPNVVYAIVEHINGGVFRSEDKGETWVKMSSANPRPMYYSQIRIDPNNDLRIWALGAPMYYSEDGGKNFVTSRVSRIHGDYHAMWINPDDSNQMIVGSDGGVHWSWDAGKTWDFVNAIAIGQFYEIGYDLEKPYRIYGGLQDNGSWGGPSQTLYRAGITNEDWFRVGGGDGYYVQVDPSDPSILYAESQDGNLFRLNLKTTESHSIRPREEEGEPRYRFQWNSPIVISSQDSKTIYYAGQFLFKSKDRGDSWEKISPDLTTGVNRDTLPIMGKVPDAKTRSRHDGVQHWPCITTISESPLNPDALWAGTDDGNLQVTGDGGKTWRNVAGRVPGLPKGTYVSRVVASRHAEGTAYATFDGHRLNDFKIYVYATADFGQTWQDISKGIPRNNGTVNVIREHHRNRNLLFVGTEYGAYVSFDRGASWESLKLNLPTVPVDDIAVHPRENDLIFGTHGRSIWVLDDITPLEQLDKNVLASELHLFDLRAATSWRIYSHKGSTGHKFFIGENPPYGALINYYLKKKLEEKEKVQVKIEDGSGHKIRQLEGTKESGINRISWDLRYGPPAELTDEQRQALGFRAQALLGGPRVEPGIYQVVVSAGEKSVKKPVTIGEDPRIEISAEDRAARHQAIMRVYEASGEAVKSWQTLNALLTSLKKEIERWKKPDAPQIPEEIKRSAEELLKKADELYERFVPPPLPEGWAGPPLEWRQPTIPQRLGRLAGELEGYTAAPADGQKKELESVVKLVKETGASVDSLVEVDLKELNRRMNQAGIPHLQVIK